MSDNVSCAKEAEWSAFSALIAEVLGVVEYVGNAVWSAGKCVSSAVKEDVISSTECDAGYVAA